MSRTLADAVLGRLKRHVSVPVVALCLMGAAQVQPALAADARLKTIYSFQAGTDGSFPRGGVITDGRGNFYGTTSSGGTGRSGVVYQLTKADDGRWSQSTLYAFTGGADGGNAQAGLLMDGQGNLYGTTYSGGSTGNGVVFKLSPPKKGQTAWKHQVLWSFGGDADGSQPTCTLTMDAAGNLYGTTQWGGNGVVGTVFKLTPPADGDKKWIKTILYHFTGNQDGGQPSGRMLIGSDGNLYGTTAGYGEFNYGNVFKLSAVGGGNWAFSVLHAFAGGSDGEVPRDGLIQGPDGRLYGATAGFFNSFGNVFALDTDGANYQVLWEVPGLAGFEHNGPWQSLSMDERGNLYGATYANGESDAGQVFQLTPPAPGKTAWTSKVLHAFQMGDANGVYPYTTVLVSKGKLYGTTYGTAGQHGFWPGTVWQIKP
ncbi:MAG: choice-of-anchor tandem repeat GloVer-containing protein [Pseudomonadota bacterium]